jgi:hypothetical protein
LEVLVEHTDHAPLRLRQDGGLAQREARVVASLLDLPVSIAVVHAQIAQAATAAPGQQPYLQFLKSVVAGNPTIVDFPANYNAVALALKNNYSNVAFGKATVAAAVDAFFSQANAAAANK